MSGSNRKSFMERALEGDADIESVDDAVAEWHESNPGVPVHEYLGMTWLEYPVWAPRHRYCATWLQHERRK